MLYSRTKVKALVEYQDVGVTVWMIESGCFGNNWYILDWSILIALGVDVCRSVGLTESYEIAPKSASVSVGVCFICGNCSGVRFVLYRCRLSDDATRTYIGYILRP